MRATVPWETSLRGERPAAEEADVAPQDWQELREKDDQGQVTLARAGLASVPLAAFAVAAAALSAAAPRQRIRLFHGRGGSACTRNREHRRPARIRPARRWRFPAGARRTGPQCLRPDAAALARLEAAERHRLGLVRVERVERHNRPVRLSQPLWEHIVGRIGLPRLPASVPRPHRAAVAPRFRRSAPIRAHRRRRRRGCGYAPPEPPQLGRVGARQIGQYQLPRFVVAQGWSEHR